MNEFPSAEPRRVLVTGAAGFIGYHVSARLLADGHMVIGLDNLSSYYDVRLKEARLERLREHLGFEFHRLDIADRGAMAALFRAARIGRVVHLAAQAGVRHSIVDPHAYVDANLAGFLNVLEGCRHAEVEHLVYASTSSVYGANTAMPFSVHHGTAHPVSLYAATKKANEMMAHSYSHLFALPTTGLRFFTVYGPWGRPDMALFRFAEAILAGRPIDLYNGGDMQRDFTYVDDIVEGVVRVLDRVPTPAAGWSGDAPDPATSSAPYRLYNIGSSAPVPLTEFITVLEQAFGRVAERRLLPMQPGDVPATYADVDDLWRDVGFAPRTRLADGVAAFARWYLDYYGGGTSEARPAPHS